MAEKVPDEGLQEESHEPRQQSEEPAKPIRRLPEIGEKPTASRRRRLSHGARWVMAVTGVIFAASTLTIKYLQSHDPGPRQTYVAPPALETLGDLAVKKGFPDKCLEDASLDPFFVAPSTKPATNSIMEYWECMYSGHADGQPASDDICLVELERDTFNDPYDFRFNVVKNDGTLAPLGITSQFSDIPATPGVPDACAQENITFP